MATLTYLPIYLCDSSDFSNSFDSWDISDSSDSSDSSDISVNKLCHHFFYVLKIVTKLKKSKCDKN